MKIYTQVPAIVYINNRPIRAAWMVVKEVSYPIGKSKL